MRKYFTWRCISLHAITLVLVPAFLLAGWWQYHVALSGNGLSWVYTVEWPVFAVYAVYVWWQLIHDQHTPFDRLWAANERAAADASGRPLHQIPGWALDKDLSRAVVHSSHEAARALELAPGGQIGALESQEQKTAHAMRTRPELGDRGILERSPLAWEPADDRASGELHHHGPVIDAQVHEVKVVVDEELDAYNRYLFELSLKDPPKRWGASRSRASGGAGTEVRTPASAPVLPVKGRRRELPPGDRDASG
jgi:hypothetical protein